jgi:hypothetical protein
LAGGQGDDVRTWFEPFLHDPEFIEIIANIKTLKVLVEEAHSQQEAGAQESSTDEVVQDTLP